MASTERGLGPRAHLEKLPPAQLLTLKHPICRDDDRGSELNLDIAAYARAVDEAFLDLVLPTFGTLAEDLKREYWRRREKDRAGANAWLRDGYDMLNRAPSWLRDIHNQEHLDAMARTIGERCEGLTSDAELDEFLARHALPPVPGQPGGPRLKVVSRSVCKSAGE